MKRTGAARADKLRKKIFLVDGDAITRTGLARLLKCEKSLKVCGEASSAAECRRFIHSFEPDLVLIDLNLPDKSGLDFLREIEMLHPNTPVLVLSCHDEALFAERALRAGARGYIMKKEGIVTLVDAIRQVLAGKIYLSAKMSTRLLETINKPAARRTRSLLGALSDREFDVFQLLGDGLTTLEISRRLNISPKTINSHRSRIKEKLNLHSAPQLMNYAARWVTIHRVA